MTQNQRLLQYLKTHKAGITQLEAFNKLGICRLSERIWELEHGNWERWKLPPTLKDIWRLSSAIMRKREKVKTRYGYATVTRYKLA